MHRVTHTLAPALRALAVLAALALGLLTTLQVGLASGTLRTDGRPTPGQHIYDTTGLLTADEIAMLEQHASGVEQAGAPCVVYLQAKDATQDQTYQDAGDLMNRWDIESSTGAQDGFVMLLDLQPGNLRHGTVELFAGKKWYDSSLPQAETQRIYSDIMLPSLESGDTAQAIADGLDAVAHDLQYGPPKPSAVQQAFRTFGGGPFIILSALYLVALAVVALRAVRSEPKPTVPEPRATPPADLPPAVVGALLHGRVADMQMEGTLLDFGRRGMLTFDSKSDDDVSIHLKKRDAALSGFEKTVWGGLDAATDSDETVTHEKMPAIRNTWESAKAELHAYLIERGWLESHATSRRTALYGLASVGALGLVVGIVVALIAQEGWALLGSLALLFGAVAGFAFAHSMTEITDAGEEIVGPWRGYANVLRSGYPQLTKEELDAALPYAVAMGYREEIGQAMLTTDTGGVGYSPSWFQSSARRGTSSIGRAGFYPYWIGWHTAMYPPPPPSSGSGGGGFGGGFGGGGAAGGGGGGGGSF